MPNTCALKMCVTKSISHFLLYSKFSFCQHNVCKQSVNVAWCIFNHSPNKPNSDCLNAHLSVCRVFETIATQSFSALSVSRCKAKTHLHPKNPVCFLTQNRIDVLQNQLTVVYLKMSFCPLNRCHSAKA